MSAKASIIIQERPADPGNWRQFVALLCLIEFYTQFVSSGQQIAMELEYHRRGTALTDEEFRAILDGAAGVLRAVMMFGLGRSLWRRSQWVRYWILRTLGVSIFCVVLGALSCLTERSGWGPYVSTGDEWVRPIHIVSAPIAALIWNAPHFPWLGLLLAGLWYAWRDRRPTKHIQPWVAFAAIWCVCCVPLFFTQQDLGQRGSHFQMTWWRYNQKLWIA
jgi:hypothetical protein